MTEIERACKEMICGALDDLLEDRMGIAEQIPDHMVKGLTNDMFDVLVDRFESTLKLYVETIKDVLRT